MGMGTTEDDGGMGMMSDINVPPFVDVMLVLLIIFMVTTPLMTTGMKVELPRADAPPLAQADQQMVLSVTVDGTYYINEYEFTLEELAPHLTDWQLERYGTGVLAALADAKGRAR